MINHLGLSVANIARSTEFYRKALEPLGYGIVMEISAAQTGHGAAIGSACRAASPKTSRAASRPSGSSGEERASGPIHVAFMARTRAGVDAFYRAALAAERTMARRACARTTTPITTAPSCSIPTATKSRPCATRPATLPPELPQGPAGNQSKTAKVVLAEERRC